jgi:hypothetical protein
MHIQEIITPIYREKKIKQKKLLQPNYTYTFKLRLIVT